MKKSIFTIIILCAVTTVFAQIPNGDFENWSTTSGYNMPNNWDNLNTMTASMSTYTCTKGTPGNPGNSYLKLISKTVTGMGVMPGMAVCGTLDMTNMSSIKPKSGFPYALRPTALTGSWQFMASGTDEGYIAVYLTKWNVSLSMRDTIASAVQPLAGMVMSWANFSINLNYTNAAAPDSAMIVLSASGSMAANNSYLYVDNLAFTGVPSAVLPISNIKSDVLIYPNPATNSLMIDCKGLKAISILDVTGKLIRNIEVTNGQSKYTVNTNELPKGTYLLKLNNGTETTVQKIVIQ